VLLWTTRHQTVAGRPESDFGRSDKETPQSSADSLTIRGLRFHTLTDVTNPAVLGLFPPGTTLNSAGEVMIGGCAASDLAAAFGTPALIIDEKALRARARAYADGLSRRWQNSLVTWASKSLPYTAVYRLMAEEGVGVDVSGGGEIMMAIAAKVDPANIVLHGNAKSDEEIALAIRSNVGTIVVDNFDDVERIERLAPRGTQQGVLVRVIPDVLPDTHAANATGQQDSKFGLSISDTRRIVELLRQSSAIRLDGFHIHIGSQILETAPFARSVEALSALSDLGPFTTYSLGGGLGAKYTYDNDPPTVDAYLDTLIDAARRVLPATARIMIEPGRSMVAEAAVTLYRITTVKRGAKTFVGVDGGMSDNLEVSLYGQRFEATITSRVGGGELCTVVGRHCESGDQLIDGVELQNPQVGDVLAIPVTGAYCLTMANNYNGALRIPIVFASEGAPRLVLRRETYEDLLRRDLH
jgi:diaminopimelate decarboxylase